MPKKLTGMYQKVCSEAGERPLPPRRRCTAGAKAGPTSLGNVRHEVARVFIKEIEIRCSATGTLPGRALGATLGCEALGTLSPPPDKRATEP